MPGFYPDVETVRSDIADYYWEVQRWDRDVAAAMQLLEDLGERGQLSAREFERRVVDDVGRIDAAGPQRALDLGHEFGRRQVPGHGRPTA